MTQASFFKRFPASLIILFTMILSLSSCGFWDERENKYSGEFGENLLREITSKNLISHKEAEATLSEAAASVSKSLYRLAEIQSAIHPKAKMPPPPNPVHIGMADLASLDWSGPVEPLLRKVAKASHYKLKVIGKRPAIPILVSITAENIPLADILRDLSFQADHQANIVLYPLRHIIELRYMGA